MFGELAHRIRIDSGCKSKCSVYILHCDCCLFIYFQQHYYNLLINPIHASKWCGLCVGLLPLCRLIPKHFKSHTMYHCMTNNLLKLINSIQSNASKWCGLCVGLLPLCRLIGNCIIIIIICWPMYILFQPSWSSLHFAANSVWRRVYEEGELVFLLFDSREPVCVFFYHFCLYIIIFILGPPI